MQLDATQEVEGETRDDFVEGFWKVRRRDDAVEGMQKVAMKLLSAQCQ